MPWIDTHCHLDAAEFDADRDAERHKAQSLGVGVCVIPAVMAAHFEEVRLLAHRHQDVYALGVHPLFTPQANEADLATLDAQLLAQQDDPRLISSVRYFTRDVGRWIDRDDSQTPTIDEADDIPSKQSEMVPPVIIFDSSAARKSTMSAMF